MGLKLYKYNIFKEISKKQKTYKNNDRDQDMVHFFHFKNKHMHQFLQGSFSANEPNKFHFEMIVLFIFLPLSIQVIQYTLLPKDSSSRLPAIITIFSSYLNLLQHLHVYACLYLQTKLNNLFKKTFITK